MPYTESQLLPHASCGPRSNRPRSPPLFTAQSFALGGQSSKASPEHGWWRVCTSSCSQLSSSVIAGHLQFLHTLLLLSLQWVKVEESLGERLSIQCGACQDWYGEGIGEPGEPTMGGGVARVRPSSELLASHRWCLIFHEGPPSRRLASPGPGRKPQGERSTLV